MTVLELDHAYRMVQRLSLSAFVPGNTADPDTNDDTDLDNLKADPACLNYLQQEIIRLKNELASQRSQVLKCLFV